MKRLWNDFFEIHIGEVEKFKFMKIHEINNAIMHDFFKN